MENDHEEKLKGWTLNCHQAFKTLGSKLAEQDNRTNLQIKKCKYLTQQLKLKQTQISSALDRIQEFRNRTMRLSQHLDDLEQSSELTELEQKLKLCQESVNSTDFEYAQIMDLTRAAIDKRKEAADTIMKQNEILNASFSLLHSHHTTAEASSQTEPHIFCSNLCREILLDIFQKLPI